MKASLLKYQREEDNAFAILREFVKRIRAKVTTETVRESLQRHPESQSLLSLSETLTEWKIDNAAIELKDAGKLHELPIPFIAHLRSRGGSFTLVTRVEENKITRFDSEKGTIKEPIHSFTDKWTRVVLIAETTGMSGEKDYATKRQVEFLNNWRIPFVLLGITSLMLLSFISWAEVANLLWIELVLSKLVGSVLSTLLLISAFSGQNTFIDSICKLNKITNCNSVLNSPGSKIGGWLSWAEIGFFYFVGGLITLLLAGNNELTLKVLALQAALALPFIFYSIYYQAIVAKKWCILCLGVQVVFIFEFLIGLPVLSTANPVWQWQSVVPMLWGVSLPILFWTFVKPFIIKAAKGEGWKKELSRFKNNSDLFRSLLYQQPKMPVVEDNLGAIVLGNKNAKHTVTMATNPYCPPCAKAHAELEILLEQQPEVNAQIIFSTCSDPEGQANQVVKHLLNLAKVNNAREKLVEWYKQPTKDYSNFNKKHPVHNAIDFNNIIKSQCDWNMKAEIKVTPTFFVNGHKLPDSYTIVDLHHVVKGL